MKKYSSVPNYDKGIIYKDEDHYHSLPDEEKEGLLNRVNESLFKIIFNQDILDKISPGFWTDHITKKIELESGYLKSYFEKRIFLAHKENDLAAIRIIWREIKRAFKDGDLYYLAKSNSEDSIAYRALVFKSDIVELYFNVIEGDVFSPFDHILKYGTGLYCGPFSMTESDYNELESTVKTIMGTNKEIAENSNNPASEKGTIETNDKNILDEDSINIDNSINTILVLMDKLGLIEKLRERMGINHSNKKEAYILSQITGKNENSLRVAINSWYNANAKHYPFKNTPIKNADEILQNIGIKNK
ncbi:hypothetical protein [Membranihabitans maritimus]|uniref:hypothetical protein n=1 Tax=Membranihabitans maritimus TaxID=2904244 RepID=UPI001F1C5DBE|nr:hypothetical protein [Membranihabitans maritimus]